MERQRTFDFTRAEQLGLLRDARIAARVASDGVRVTPQVQKAVLRVIDDHGRGSVAWVGYETLAAESGCSLRTVKRAVQVLEAASLLCVDTRRSRVGVVCNHYSIVWSELALLRRDLCPPGPIPPPERSAVATERSAVATERSAVATERSAVATLAECRGDTQTAPEALKKRTEPPPPTPSEPAGGGGEWQAIVQTWQPRIQQIATVAAAAAEAGQSPEEFAQAVTEAWETATHPANASTIRKPAGAVLYHLRTGGWPCEGVIAARDTAAVSTAVADREAAVAQACEREVARQRERSGLQAMAAIAKLRRAGRDDAAILQELRARWPQDVLAAIGW